jgi:peptidoglycan-N-acetylglucosamine deacetylase
VPFTLWSTEVVVGVEGMLGVAGVAAAWGMTYGVPAAWRRREERSLRGLARAHRTLVLSYDDGPGPLLTPQLLGMLEAYRAQATFFMLGSRAAVNPELVDRVRAGGHEVACHTYDHTNAWRSLPWAATRDIREGYVSLRRWMEPDALFRPPYGKMTLFTRWALSRRGARIGWWTIDSGDTHARVPNPEGVGDTVMRDGGGVVLLHDFDRAREAQERSEFVLRVTELLLTLAEREGLCVRRLSDLLKLEGTKGTGSSA